MCGRIYRTSVRHSGTAWTPHFFIPVQAASPPTARASERFWCDFFGIFRRSSIFAIVWSTPAKWRPSRPSRPRHATPRVSRLGRGGARKLVWKQWAWRGMIVASAGGRLICVGRDTAAHGNQGSGVFTINSQDRYNQNQANFAPSTTKSSSLADFRRFLHHATGRAIYGSAGHVVEKSSDYIDFCFVSPQNRTHSTRPPICRPCCGPLRVMVDKQCAIWDD